LEGSFITLTPHLTILSIAHLFCICPSTNLSVSSHHDQTRPLPNTGRSLQTFWPDSPTGDRIVGGFPAEDGAWPWQVGIFQSGTFICGGSLVNKEWVLCAAHCVSSGRLTSLRLSFYNVKEILMYPGFQSSQTGRDVSLLQLDQTVMYSNFISHISLPNVSDVFTAQDECWVTGWGSIKSGVSLPSPGTLQQVQVPIINNTVCNSTYYKDGYQIGSDMICAGYMEGGKDACQGDSGGPLVCRRADNSWVQAGIVSWGLGCAQVNAPGVYTRVTAYVNWIIENSNVTSSGTTPVVPNVSLRMVVTTGAFHWTTALAILLPFLLTRLCG
uniref:Peptidase S1 domain-containing protein n=1 Tax=Erpetoichthys calabaricus TaxID=27687 RepID=A0A8C4SCL7_ERPCA